MQAAVEQAAGLLGLSAAHRGDEQRVLHDLALRAAAADAHHRTGGERAIRARPGREQEVHALPAALGPVAGMRRKRQAAAVEAGYGGSLIMEARGFLDRRSMIGRLSTDCHSV